MNTQKPDGGPAYPGVQGVPGYGPSAPVTLPNGTIEWANYAPGATLRDYFAIGALQGMLSSDSSVDRTKIDKAKWAAVAYSFSDAMLTERETP